jgi:hypothetical protein
MAVPNFYAKEQITFQGTDEVPGFNVGKLGRMPEDLQSYPRLKLLPAELWPKIFDTNFPGNDCTIPESPIITVTVADAFAEGPTKAARRSSGAPQAEKPAPPVGGGEGDEVPKEPAEPEAKPFAGLRLPHQAVSSLLANGYDTLDKVRAVDQAEVQKLPGVGPGSIAKLYKD